jgi:GNAT superfamily N-acetyltransferase
MVRVATTDDVPSIVVLNTEVQALHAASLPDLFKSPDATALAQAVAAMVAGSRNLVLLAEVGDEPAGYAYAEFISRGETPHRHAEDMVYLHHLSVSGAHQRRGVATALITALRASAAERTITRIALDVWAFNEGGARFLQASRLRGVQ